MKKTEGLRSTDGQLQNSHRDVTHGTGNMVNTTVITVRGARWVLEILGELFVQCVFVYAVQIQKPIQNDIGCKL